MSSGDQYNLVRRGKFWVADFTLHGQRVHRSTKCVIKADAIERCDLWAKEIRDRKDGITPKPIAPTLRKAYDEWKRVMRSQVVPLHVVNMRSAVETHAADYLDTPIDQIDNAAAMAIRSKYLSTKGRGYRKGQDWEAERAHTEGGANSVIRRLSGLMGWCVETGRIKQHPFKIKALKAQPKPKGIVWPEQVQAFYAEADKGGRQHVAKDPKKRAEQVRTIPHSAVAMRLMMSLGLREEEALGARWEWLDRRRKVYIVGMAKDRSLREVPVPDWLMGFLLAWGEDKRSGLMLPGDKEVDGEPLPHHKNFTQKPVERVAREMKISGLTPHRLRATFATTHFEAGTALTQIAQMMGHEDPETTFKHYIVLRSKDQAEAQNRVAELQGFTKSTQNAPETNVQC